MPADPVNEDLKNYDKKITRDDIISEYINETEDQMKQVNEILQNRIMPIAETLDKLEVIFTQLQDQISYTRDLLKPRR